MGKVLDRAYKRLKTSDNVPITGRVFSDRLNHNIENLSKIPDLSLKQEFLKLKIEQHNRNNATRLLVETQNKIDCANREIVFLSQRRLDVEQELCSLEKALASNDAHRLYEEIGARIKRIEYGLADEEEKAEQYRQLKSQCEALINRALLRKGLWLLTILRRIKYLTKRSRQRSIVM